MKNLKVRFLSLAGLMVLLAALFAPHRAGISVPDHRIYLSKRRFPPMQRHIKCRTLQLQPKLPQLLKLARH